MKKLHAIALLGAAALVLTACGGGGDAPAPAAPVASTDIPGTATADPAGLLVFVNAQVNAPSDTAEPLLVGDAVLPADDSTETSL
ncbi:hypothetical protein ACFPOE_04760 [Caenimonas terrae]|uniref:DUF4397 domain-containing protein n=1 Tax=Caenimonas terrae TaxID=696074 RepID=A0ABW0NCB3_9BURK